MMSLAWIERRGSAGNGAFEVGEIWHLRSGDFRL